VNGALTLAELVADEQLERRVRGLERPALGLQRLDPLDHPADRVGRADRSTPSSLPLSSTDARPAISVTRMRMSLPTSAGSTWL
jgi:hypothetical protein